MSAVLERVDPRVALAAVHAELDALQAADLSGLGEEEFLDYARELERARRRLPSLDHAVVTGIQDRGLLDTHQVRSGAQLLRGLLRLDPRAATGRVAAAQATGARRGLTGQPLPPIYPELAAAQAAGDLSERHARVIVETIEKLPEQVQAEVGEQIEADLIGYANRFDPHQLATIALRLRYCYDQDGRFDDTEQRAKQRGIAITARPDGSCSGTFEGTAEFAEFLLTTFDALGKPLPEIDGVKDPRTAAQRRHDALLDALKLNVRAQTLPSIAGVTATIVLTMTADDYEQRQGLARTAHGALLPVAEAMRIAAGEYRLLNVVIDHTHAITAHSGLHRLYTETHRLALAAPDAGCTFPNCHAPPGRCEIDHALDWALGGTTTLDNAVMACRYHNNNAKKQGWTPTRINNRAAWIPPHWIDPTQQPQFNDLHNTDIPEPDGEQ
jgi:hypothetical protein